MNIFQKVTLKTLKENKTRTIVTIIGIILSLAMFTAVTVSLSSFLNYMLKVTIARTGNWHGTVPVSGDGLEELLSDDEIDTISFLENIGYARIDEITNPNKPYLFIAGMDENASGTLPITLTDGRLPKNEHELLLPEHLSYNGGVSYALSDELTLQVGDRISPDQEGNPCVLRQDTPYLYTEEELKEQGLQKDSIAARDTEALVAAFTRTYTVVGFYERPSTEPYSAPGYTALTVSSVAGRTDPDRFYTAYLRFQNPKRAIPWMEEHFPYTRQSNDSLLRMYASSYESSYNAVLYGLAFVLIFIILFGSVSLIYNAFSISVTERTKQFGLLASLGATKKQLKKSVLFEALVLCAIGIPVGILSGIAGIGITFTLLGSSISDALWGEYGLTLTMHVTYWSVFGAAFLGLLTVLISAYLPARRAAKLSPIDAIRMTTDIAIRPGKVRTSRLTYKIFSLPDMLASKNFKRNRKKYRATVFSLFVSVVLFISASSFCSYLIRSVNSVFSDSGYDISYNRYSDDTDDTASNDALCRRLSGLDSVENAAYIQQDNALIYADRDAVSRDYLEYLSLMYPDSLPTTEQGQVLLEARICFVNDSAYEAFRKELDLPAVASDTGQPAAIAFDFYRYYNGEDEKYHTFRILDTDHADITFLQAEAPEGYTYSYYSLETYSDPVYCFSNSTDLSADDITLPASDCTKKKELSMTVCQNTLPFFLADYYSYGLVLLYPSSAMEAVLGTDWAAQMKNGLTEFIFTAPDHKKATADISDTLKEMNLGYNSVRDHAESAEQDRNLLLVVTVFSYGFIILISLIALANVFNTISTNIQIRRREFAMLKSTGMTPGGFTVMMCYECLLYGIKGLLYGLPTAILVTCWIYRSVANGLELSFYIPWYSLFIAIGSVFLVVGSTMIYSMKKIEKENIMDNLKSENF